MKPSLRPASDRDFEFALRAKQDAMGPHIAARWAWDEAQQRSIHEQRWREKSWFIVMLGDEPIGTAAVDEHPEYVRFGEFYLLGNFRRRGFGTVVLNELLQRCDSSGRQVRLEYLKWNPVGSLYERHGFEVVSENDTHYFMVREPR